jgi:hypothetical protein
MRCKIKAKPTGLCAYAQNLLGLLNVNLLCGVEILYGPDEQMKMLM